MMFGRGRGVRVGLRVGVAIRAIAVRGGWRVTAGVAANAGLGVVLLVGCVVAVGTPEQVAASAGSITGVFLRARLDRI